MARPKREINPNCGHNLKQLCSEVGITQAALAERIDRTPQTITRIVQGRYALTQDVAERIIAEYPQYRIEWLLGLSDIKTKSEEREQQSKKLAVLYSKNKRAVNQRQTILNTLAARCGYEITLKYSGPDGESYTIQKDGKETYIADTELTNLVDELEMIAAFHFSRWLNPIDATAILEQEESEVY